MSGHRARAGTGWSPIIRRRRSQRSASTPATGPRIRTRQVLRGEGQPGVAQRAGDQEDVRRDGQHQQPRAEGADQAAAPQQPEVPDPQGLEHDRATCPDLSVDYSVRIVLQITCPVKTGGGVERHGDRPPAAGPADRGGPDRGLGRGRRGPVGALHRQPGERPGQPDDRGAGAGWPRPWACGWSITLGPAEEAGQGRRAGPRRCRASLVRLGRTAGSGRRSRPWPRRSAGTPTSSPPSWWPRWPRSAQAMGRDLAEPDWWRLLDALLLVAAHPSAPAAEGGEPRGSPR